MPIANCTIIKELSLPNSDLIKLWSRESGQSHEHMTVNLIKSEKQFGNAYKVMAALYLPSLWSNEGADSLQLGLAKALQRYFNIEMKDIHIITLTIESGKVVEDGEIVNW